MISLFSIEKNYHQYLLVVKLAFIWMTLWGVYLKYPHVILCVVTKKGAHLHHWSLCTRCLGINAMVCFSFQCNIFMKGSLSYWSSCSSVPLWSEWRISILICFALQQLSWVVWRIALVCPAVSRNPRVRLSVLHAGLWITSNRSCLQARRREAAF